MRPAEREADLLMTPGQRRIGTIAVDLQDAGKAGQVRFGSLGLAIAGVDIGYTSGEGRGLIATGA